MSSIFSLLLNYTQDFSNGLIIAWLLGEIHDVTLALPIAFSNSDYVVNGPFWIDTIIGIAVTKTATSISLVCYVKHGWTTGGLSIIGF